MTPILTPRQDLFAKQMATGNSATQSAILAGYSKTSARFTASKLLTNTNILQRIEELFDQAGLSDEALITRLKKAIDTGIGKKANNSDAIKGMKLAFELKGRLDHPVEIHATQESDLRIRLNAMSTEELTQYLQTLSLEVDKLKSQVSRLPPG